ncbi:MAG TPA: L-seryl-tRNA(Sec) selenium transferase, partial [Nitrolancea sp.]|nr:L-seryl-tRNA(Sec) selenium transferase [Nitrolancea sp.]
MNGVGDEWHSRRKGPTVTNQTDSMTRRDALRHLPSISALLLAPEVVEVAAGLRPEIVTGIAQRAVERARAAIMSGAAQGEPCDVIDAVRREIELLTRPKLSPVINGTGVIIHTNLGRAPVSSETARAMAEAAAHYTPLELEIDTGRRGGRAAEITRLIATLTGAESTLVVNNN